MSKPTCPQCGKSFKTTNGLDWHVSNIHGPEPKVEIISRLDGECEAYKFTASKMTLFTIPQVLGDILGEIERANNEMGLRSLPFHGGTKSHYKGWSDEDLLSYQSTLQSIYDNTSQLFDPDTIEPMPIVIHRKEMTRL